MKRIIIIIFSAVMVISASAQNVMPLDGMFKQIQKETHLCPYITKGNYGGGKVQTSYRMDLGFMEFCSEKICGHKPSLQAPKGKDVEAVNEIQRNVLKKVIGIIRYTLDSLSEKAEESYHFEKHSKGTDSISYSICLKNKILPVLKSNYTFRGYYFPDATETITFYFNTGKKKGCNVHRNGLGSLEYNKIETVNNGKTIDFNWQAFFQTIMPELKKKGVKSRKFRWVCSDVETHPVYAGPIYGDTLSLYDCREGVFVNDTTTSYKGETVGTMYYVPRKNWKVAQVLINHVDSLIQKYIDQHPEQRYSYIYGINETYSHNVGDGHLQPVLNIWDYRLESPKYKISYGSDKDNLYIVVTTTKGGFSVPKGWSKLKSFINGKKIYIK